MRRYCLDANIFIQAKNGPYGFDIVPAFWALLDREFSNEVIFSSRMVYEELSVGGDELASWVQQRRNFFIQPNQEVQKTFQSIANYVSQNYPNHQAQLFLGGADPWVIAHAKMEKAVVVTHEVLVPTTSTKVKIPNICRQFDVEYMNPYQMLRELKAKF